MARGVRGRGGVLVTLTSLFKTPFQYYGGKSDAAALVWEALGDVEHYVEPFAGSLAVLLRRPHEPNRTYHSETVNDADGLLVNAWRSIQLSPDATAEAASNPVAEADLHARHGALVRWRAETQLEHLMGDPAWHDPVMAGWWIWGTACWIGSGFASGGGGWTVDETGRLVRGAKPGVSRQLPHLSDNGRGVNHAGTREPGVDDGEEFHPVTMPEVRRWFAYLSARLRHVRILNGDWTRACTGGAAKTINVRQGGHAGIFLDPPYATSERDANLYVHDSGTIAADVLRWCQANGADPRYRIVLAGYDSEHAELVGLGWREVEWFKSGFLKGGYAQQSAAGHQQKRERLWLSPHCIAAALPATVAQQSLFGGAA